MIILEWLAHLAQLALLVSNKPAGCAPIPAEPFERDDKDNPAYGFQLFSGSEDSMEKKK